MTTQLFLFMFSRVKVFLQEKIKKKIIVVNQRNLIKFEKKLHLESSSGTKNKQVFYQTRKKHSRAFFGEISLETSKKPKN